MYSLHDSFPKIKWKKIAVHHPAYSDKLENIINSVSWYASYHQILANTEAYIALHTHKFSSLWTRDFQHQIWPGRSFYVLCQTSQTFHVIDIYYRYRYVHVCLTEFDNWIDHFGVWCSNDEWINKSVEPYTCDFCADL